MKCRISEQIERFWDGRLALNSFFDQLFKATQTILLVTVSQGGDLRLDGGIQLAPHIASGGPVDKIHQQHH